MKLLNHSVRAVLIVGCSERRQYLCWWDGWDLWTILVSGLHRLGKHLGIISKIEVSSTNLIWPFQSSSKGLIKISNGIGPSFVHRGRPRLVLFHKDLLGPIFTHCSRFVRNALIQRMMTGWTSRFLSSSKIILWSTKSKLFLKSAKNILAEQRPLSKPLRIECKKGLEHGLLISLVGKTD